MTDVAYSASARRQAARKKVADLIYYCFGDAGHTQKAVAKAAGRFVQKSDRMVINYMQRKNDAPHYVAEMLEDWAVQKAERIARRIGGDA